MFGAAQLRLRRAVSVHDPDFSTVGKAVEKEKLSTIWRPIATTERGIFGTRCEPGLL